MSELKGENLHPAKISEFVCERTENIIGKG